MAVLLATLLATLALPGFAGTDYDAEAAEAFAALAAGDLERFLAVVPAYGGSFVLRAPFAWTAGLWGGGELAVYRAVSVACLVASVALAVLVVGRMRAQGRPRLSRAVVLVTLVATPQALRALLIGHPEELLGGALCVGAVLLAPSRPMIGAVLLGLAVANKPWALVAAPVVLAVVPSQAILRTALLSGAIALAVMAPLVLFGGNFGTAAVAQASTGAIYQPWQAWYLLGDETGQTLPGQDHRIGTRLAPAWVPPITRPLILALPVLLAGAWWWRRRGRVAPVDGLLLLALVLHLRCLLDPWNNEYYALPAIFALVAWEGLTRVNRAPVVTLGVLVLHWITFMGLRETASPDVSSLFYLAWALPLAAWMAIRLFRAAHVQKDLPAMALAR